MKFPIRKKQAGTLSYGLRKRVELARATALKSGLILLDEPMAGMNREGRTIEQRRKLALEYMDIITFRFGIDSKNQYITFTQHPGDDFHLVEKYLGAWQPEEEPLAE